MPRCLNGWPQAASAGRIEEPPPALRGTGGSLRLSSRPSVRAGVALIQQVEQFIEPIQRRAPTDQIRFIILASDPYRPS